MILSFRGKMRSFLEYRKNKIQSKISIQDSVTEYFDILRLELLETVKLPELLFEGSLITESAYNAARKEDYTDNKEIIELIISESKGNFCNRIFNEEIASDLSINDFIDNIKQLIQGEVETLKKQVATVLITSRPTASEPEANTKANPATNSWKDRPISSGQRGAFYYYKKHYNATLPLDIKNMTQGQASDVITKFEKQYGPLPDRSGSIGSTAAPSTSNGGDLDVGYEPIGGNASRTPNRDSASNAGSNSFTPAPRGNIRPSDGFLRGLKRTVWDPVTGWAKDKWRNFRRRWHNDPLREHQGFLETIFLENYVDLSKVIEDFGKDLTDMLVKRVRDYVAGTTGKPVSATSTKDSEITTRAGSPTTNTKPPANNEKDSNVQEPETVDVARTVAPEAGEKTETVEEVRYKNGAKIGAEALGLKTDRDGSTIKYLDSSGKTLNRDEIIKLLFDKFLEKPSQEYRDEVSTTTRHVVDLKKKRHYVAKWLGIPDAPKEEGVKRILDQHRKSIQRLLFNFYVKQQENMGITIKELPNRTVKTGKAISVPDKTKEDIAEIVPLPIDVKKTIKPENSVTAKPTNSSTSSPTKSAALKRRTPVNNDTIVNDEVIKMLNKSIDLYKESNKNIRKGIDDKVSKISKDTNKIITNFEVFVNGLIKYYQENKNDSDKTQEEWKSFFEEKIRKIMSSDNSDTPYEVPEYLETWHSQLLNNARYKEIKEKDTSDEQEKYKKSIELAKKLYEEQPMKDVLDEYEKEVEEQTPVTS